jgi:hypothetical protein
MEVGALSLRFTYSQSVAQFEGISIKENLNIVSRAKDGEISLAWADLTGGKSPLNLKANTVIGVMKFKMNNNNKGGFNLDIANGSEFSDVSGNVLKNAGLLVPNVNSDQPTEFTLNQNYPNPFNPSTTLSYTLPESGNVKITIYNVTGQVVTQLVNGVQNAGSYKKVWNASNLSSGIYFYKLNFESANIKYSDIKSMILLK